MIDVSKLSDEDIDKILEALERRKRQKRIQRQQAIRRREEEMILRSPIGRELKRIIQRAQRGSIVDTINDIATILGLFALDRGWMQGTKRIVQRVEKKDSEEESSGWGYL
ncbi:MAG: hypothetical protein Q6363_004285 [Candidatus Njordarchaeota archaeon]